MRRARLVLGVAALTATVATITAASAFGCTNLATMTLSSNNGHPGDTITLIGTSFPVPRATSGTPATPVTIRWKANDGEVLAEVVPDRTGTITVTFTVPPSEPGNVVILGTQKRTIVNPDRPDAPPAYLDEPGTPARATFRVLAPGELAPPTMVAGDFTGVQTDAGTTAMIVMMVLFGTVAMSLFAGGVIAFLHQVRTRRMTPQPWRHW